MTKFKIISMQVGRPGASIYKPAETLGYIEAPSKMRALDAVAEKIGARHMPRTHTIPVLGIGSITVEEV